MPDFHDYPEPVLDRRQHEAAILQLLREFPVVGLIGARQVGKTTLARSIAQLVSEPVHAFDLEDPVGRARLAEPSLALAPLAGLVVLDEVQHVPDLFRVLRVLVDRPEAPARFLVLGSASPALLRQGSESLAGRIVYHVLPPLDVAEVGADGTDRLWLRGGFPRAFLADSEPASMRWRRAFVMTHVERDLPSLGLRLEPTTIRRFWTMLGHYHGQTWNGAELARAFGVSERTVGRYLDLLCETFMARRLEPWHENVKKRQRKAPKTYVADSGLLHALLDLTTRDDLLGHPKVGASFEGFAIGQVVRRLGARADQCFHWAVHSGPELDLLVVHGRRRLGFEIKHTASPAVTPSMRAAIDVLGLDSLDVVHAGEHTFPLASAIRAVAVGRLLTDVAPLP